MKLKVMNELMELIRFVLGIYLNFIMKRVWNEGTLLDKMVKLFAWILKCLQNMLKTLRERESSNQPKFYSRFNSKHM